MKDQPIYQKTQGSGKYKRETYVLLIGEGNYAVTQTELFNPKMEHTIYLTHQDLTEILKEHPVKL